MSGSIMYKLLSIFHLVRPGFKAQSDDASGAETKIMVEELFRLKKQSESLKNQHKRMSRLSLHVDSFEYFKDQELFESHLTSLEEWHSWLKSHKKDVREEHEIVFGKVLIDVLQHYEKEVRVHKQEVTDEIWELVAELFLFGHWSLMRNLPKAYQRGLKRCNRTAANMRKQGLKDTSLAEDELQILADDYAHTMNDLKSKLQRFEKISLRRQQPVKIRRPNTRLLKQ